MGFYLNLIGIEFEFLRICKAKRVTSRTTPTTRIKAASSTHWEVLQI